MILPSLPKDIFKELNIDRDLNRDEVIRIFNEVMDGNLQAVYQFFDNEKELLKLLKHSGVQFSEKQAEKMTQGIYELKNILLNQQLLNTDKIKLIHSWYDKAHLGEQKVIFLLFVLLVILGISNFASLPFIK